MEYEKGGALSKDESKKKEATGGHGKKSAKGHRHVHFHQHDEGVAGHVLHPDGSSETHHFQHEDHGGMADLLREHMSAGGGGEGGGGGEEQAEAGGAGGGGAAGAGGAPQEQQEAA